MKQALRESCENRQLGASFVVGRKTRNGTQVLIMNDKPKIEVAAGMSQWFIADPKAWSFPGGGRSIIVNGQQETREETLRSELSEEMGLLLPTDVLKNGLVQKHPLMVGQKRKDKINQIGVTSAFYWFDQFSHSEQKFIQNKEQEDFVCWINLKQIEFLWNLIQKYDKKITKVNFRPQLLMTSYLWFLDIVCGWSDEALKIKINSMNIKTRKFLVQQTQLLKIPIKNGAFTDLGRALPPSKLTTSDALFLYGKTI